MARKAGIPTEHRYTRFRSRLEARWAAFFDAIGWRWEYEPFDVDGYIPDFAILGARPFLVEVKPAMALFELSRHVAKLEKTGREALLVGVSPWLPSEHGYYMPVAGLLLQEMADQADDSELYADEAIWCQCETCAQIGVYHFSGVFDGYPCGHYNGGGGPGLIEDETIDRAWAEARNLTQWRGA